MVNNPLSPFFKPSEQAIKFAQNGTVLGLTTIGISKYKIAITRVGGIEIPALTSIPISALACIATVYIISLFLIYYFEELFEFNRTDFENTANELRTAREEDNDGEERFKNILKSLEEKSFVERSKQRIAGIIKHFLILSAPITVLLFCIYFEYKNVLLLFSSSANVPI